MVDATDLGVDHEANVAYHLLVQTVPLVQNSLQAALSDAVPHTPQLLDLVVEKASLERKDDQDQVYSVLAQIT